MLIPITTQIEYIFKTTNSMKLFIKSIQTCFVILSVLLTITSCKQQDRESAKPNILWIIADDLGTDLACYGTLLVKTPNLDQLATEGTRFTNLFTVCAVCSPSRSALVTGMYPVSINCHQHRTYFKKPLPEGIRPVTEYFREAGYFVCNGSVTDINRPGKQDYNFVAENIYDGTDWRQRSTGQSFFAQIQIHGPHREFQRDPQNPVNADSIKLPPYYPDHPLARQDWALYLENIQIVDRQVGEILKRLDDDGLADSTVVFFFGDQGRPHVRAKQFLYDGGIRTPLIIRWPGHIDPEKVDNRLISNIDLPVASMVLAGIEPPGYIHGIDFLSTADPVRDAIFAMRDRRDETVDRIRCVRTEKYKYIRNFYPEQSYTQFNAYKKHQYPVLTLMQVLNKRGELDPVQARFMAPNRPAEELYDLLNDPFEINNLAENEDYANKLEEMRDMLDEWMVKYDKGEYPENPEEIAYWEKAMKENFKERMANRGLSPDIPDEEFLDYWNRYLTPTKKENQ
jgi:arylsulfatase A-like enzyme